MKALIIRLEGELDYIQDRGLKWDATKCELRGLTVAHSFKKKSKMKKQHIKTVNIKLNELQISLTDNASDYILAEYEDLEQEHVRGAIIRSKTKWT